MKYYSLLLLVFFVGCSSRHTASDVLLTAVGGLIGYETSDGGELETIGGAVAGLALSKAGNHIVDNQIEKVAEENRRIGYNQHVKETFWQLQDLQKHMEENSNKEEDNPRYFPIPREKHEDENGVLRDERIEYIIID